MSRTLPHDEPVADEPEPDDVDELDGHAAGPDLPALGRWLVVTGVLGLVAAFLLTADKVKILENPSFRPACDLNPVLSCGSVMVTDQASVFGFPNSMIGLMAFPVVLTLGVLMAARVRMPRWVLGGLAIGSVLGLVFIHWLAFQSLYRINALCPWCMVVWAATILTSVFTVLTAMRTGNENRLVETLWSVRYLIVLFWYLVFLVAILIQFWDYWSTLI